ncbi:MAG TPA: hypothetical protein DCL73_02130 [Treponema sp.]|nr:hypothetical protein [Treponema sp.]
MEENETAQHGFEDAEEKAKRAAFIKKTEMKHRSTIFMIVASVVEIIVTLVIMVGLYILAAWLIYKVFKSASPLPFQIAYPLIFILGMILGFIVYKRIMRFGIDKFNLRDKLRPDIADHYLTRKEWKDKNNRK